MRNNLKKELRRKMFQNKNEITKNNKNLLHMQWIYKN